MISRINSSLILLLKPKMTTTNTTTISIDNTSDESSPSCSSDSDSTNAQTIRLNSHGVVVPRKSIRLSSFGYECVFQPDRNKTTIFDVRGLPNPTKSMIAKGMTGRDKKLRDDLFSNPEVEEFYQKALAQIIEAVKNHKDDPNVDPVDNVLNFAFGCHRGKHRSVSFVERLKIDLDRDHMVSICHYHLVPQKSKDYKKLALQKRSIKYDDDNDNDNE
jgi:RNase adaptor protein for sRNA GlmZ degradation